MVDLSDGSEPMSDIRDSLAAANHRSGQSNVRQRKKSGQLPDPTPNSPASSLPPGPWRLGSTRRRLAGTSSGTPPVEMTESSTSESSAFRLADGKVETKSTNPPPRFEPTSSSSSSVSISEGSSGSEAISSLSLSSGSSSKAGHNRRGTINGYRWMFSVQYLTYLIRRSILKSLHQRSRLNQRQAVRPVPTIQRLHSSTETRMKR